MRVFITDLGSSISSELTRNCQDAGLEVVGTVARGGKSEMVTLKRQLLSHSNSVFGGAIKEPIALQSNAMAWRQLVQKADVVVVTSLIADLKLAIDLLEAVEEHAMVQDEEKSSTEGGRGFVKRFIAVSSILSWSKNQPFAASAPDAGHKEDDFKSRRPVRNYTDLKAVETKILNASRIGELETCIVGAGLIYGGVQSHFKLLFRQAWLQPDRPLLVPSLATESSGCNLLPMISFYDLALLVSRLAAFPSPLPKKYVLAVDKASGSTTLRDVCRGVSKLLGSGHLRRREDAAIETSTLLLDEEDEQLKPLQLNLRFDTSTGAMHTMVTRKEWRHYSNGLVGNLAFFVDEFIQAFDLRPLRIIILGPPRVGKTLLSRKLAQDYYLPYLSPATLLQELFVPETDAMQWNHSKKEEEQHENEATEKTKLRQALQPWAPQERGPGEFINQLPDTALVPLVRWKLRSAVCCNHGYVLDGLPLSVAQAEQIFMQESNKEENYDENDEVGDNKRSQSVNDNGDEDEEEEEEEEDAASEAAASAVNIEKLLTRMNPRRHVELPNRVILLQAPRTVLEKRAQALSEVEAQETEDTEQAFANRFDEFQANIEAVETFVEKTKSTVQSTAAADSLKVLKLWLNDEDEDCDDEAFATAIQRYVEQGGRAPCNFHPTRAEIREQCRETEQLGAAKLTRAQEAQDGIASEWARLDYVQGEETELLETRAKPLRAYLMDTVLPALTQGMSEIAKVQPVDSIEYLAEFFYRKGKEWDEKMNEA